ncbi:MAG: MucBP domain-containing protein [Blautia sp.]|nr:MucBP domain-containing protein [Blautia sp.]
MKRLGRYLVCAVLMCSLLLGGRTIALADTYTYTVTIYAGNQGTVKNASGISVASKHPAKVQISVGKNKIVISGLSYGDNVSCNAQRTVAVAADSKYYVRGIRLSGRDNNTIAKNAAFTVAESQDYVIAYGILGKMTTYTVSYVDELGNELADSQTYSGNVGDEPVLAYMYVDGYVPVERNITRTLSENVAENEFRFVYTPGQDTSIAEPGDAGDGEGTDGENGANGGTGADGQNGADGNNGNAGEALEEGGEASVVDIENAGGSEEERGLEINTIEDNAVPLAGNAGAKSSAAPLARAKENGMLAPIIIGVVAAVGFIVTLILFFRFKSRKRER